jgi:AcrR family transcriptional regulator
MENDILIQARNMFMKYGLKSVTMDDVAKELSISKKTLYELFKDKADLIRQVFNFEVDRMAGYIRDLTNDNTNVIDKMIAINEHLIEMRKNFPENIKFDLNKYYPEIMNENRILIEGYMRVAIKENLILGQKQGLFREDIDCDIIAALQVARANIVDDIIRQLQSYDYEKIITTIFDYHIRAICTEQGFEYYINKIKKS